MSSATEMTRLVVKLAADAGNSKATVKAFEDDIVKGVTNARGATAAYATGMKDAKQATKAAGVQAKQTSEFFRDAAGKLRHVSGRFATEQERIRQEIDKTNSKFRKGLMSAGQYAEGLKSAGRKATMWLTTPIVGAGAAMLKFGSDSVETANKFDAVFADALDKANAAVLELDKSYGQTTSSAQKLMGATGDLLTGFGFTADTASDLSLRTQKLAVDLASFTNVQGGTARASRALTKAMLGEREMLKELGIAILEKDVLARVALLQAQGMTFETTRQAKAYAVLEMAIEQSKNAIGDYQKTAGEVANQTREMWLEVKELAATFGKDLLPIAKTIITDILRPMIGWFQKLPPEARQVILIVGAIVAAVGPLLIIVGQLTLAISSVATAWPAITAGVGAFMSLKTAMVATRVAAVAFAVWIGLKLANEIKNSTQAMKDFNNAMREGEALANRMARRQMNRQQKALADIKEEDDPARRLAKLNKLHDTLQNEVQGKAASVEGLKQQLENQLDGRGVMGTLYDKMYGNADTDLLDANLKEGQAQLEALRDFVEEVESELSAAAGETEQVAKENATKLNEAMGGVSGAVAGMWNEATFAMGVGEMGAAKKKVAGMIDDFFDGVIDDLDKDKGGGLWKVFGLDKPPENLGLIHEMAVDITELFDDPVKVRFETEGLDVLRADGMDMLAALQAQALIDVTTKVDPVEVAADASHQTAAATSMATSMLPGIAGFGLAMGHQAAAKAPPVPVLPMTSDQKRTARREAAVARREAAVARREARKAEQVAKVDDVPKIPVTAPPVAAFDDVPTIGFSNVPDEPVTTPTEITATVPQVPVVDTSDFSDMTYQQRRAARRAAAKMRGDARRAEQAATDADLFAGIGAGVKTFFDGIKPKEGDVPSVDIADVPELQVADAPTVPVDNPPMAFTEVPELVIPELPALPLGPMPSLEIGPAPVAGFGDVPEIYTETAPTAQYADVDTVAIGDVPTAPIADVGPVVVDVPEIVTPDVPTAQYGDVPDVPIDEPPVAQFTTVPDLAVGDVPDVGFDAMPSLEIGAPPLAEFGSVPNIRVPDAPTAQYSDVPDVGLPDNVTTMSTQFFDKLDAGFAQLFESATPVTGDVSDAVPQEVSESVGYTGVDVTEPDVGDNSIFEAAAAALGAAEGLFGSVPGAEFGEPQREAQPTIIQQTDATEQPDNEGNAQMVEHLERIADNSDVFAEISVAGPV